VFIGVCDPIVTWGLGSWRAEVPRPIVEACRAIVAPAASSRVPAVAVGCRTVWASTASAAVDGRRESSVGIVRPSPAVAIVRRIESCHSPVPCPMWGPGVQATANVAGTAAALGAMIAPGVEARASVRGMNVHAMVVAVRVEAKMPKGKGCPCPTT
jgi:hypothetical protein